MKNRTIFLSAMVATLLTLQSVNIFAQDDEGDHEQSRLPVEIFWAKRSDRPVGAKVALRSPSLISHGGNVMSSVQVTAIFWGPSWGNANFAKDKMTGLQTFYMGIGGSPYAKTSDEYSDAKGPVTDIITYTQYLMDLSTAPSRGRVSPVLAEVCKLITSPSPNGYYPVYVDTPRGSAGFCAWHSAGYCGSTPVQFAFFFNLDGDPGCDPEDKSSLHSQGLAALANVSGHEISEARTDPHLDAWYDSAGDENADKCAWSFGTPLLTFSDHSQWKIQGNWSNNAFNAGTGYANSRAQKGCIDGGNYK